MDLLLVLLIIFIPLLAELYINRTYKNCLNKESSNKLTGFDVARKILNKNGLNDMVIIETNGTLTDHYDPKRKVIKLSKSIYKEDSIASIAVAAHETGHALQDKEGYSFLRIRTFIFPIVSFMSRIAYIVLFLGFLFEILDLVYLGIIAVGSGVVFQFVTLPVEFNASRRAINELVSLNLINESDKEDVENMLRAAALTYVASTLAELLQLLRLINMSKRD